MVSHLRRRSLGMLLAISASSLADAARAHDIVQEAGLLAGLSHPISGLDHLLAMIAVGVVSVVLGNSAVWRVPAAFLFSMLVGAMVGYIGVEFRKLEFGVALSVLILGIAVAAPSLARWRSALFGAVAVFGFCHGHLHGLELPDAAAPLQFSFGFLLSSLFLHICGLFGAEMIADSPWGVKVRRVAGLLMASVGVWFVWQKLFVSDLNLALVQHY
jgi:urease accessory protein